MSAPTRAPYYWDHGTSEEGDPAEKASGWLIDDFARHPKYFAEWLIEYSGVKIDIALVDHRGDETCTIGFTGGGISGTVTFAKDPSGWVLVTAEVGGTEMFRGYLDRPWEMYEIWPPGATPGTTAEGRDEGPGRIGKKQTWIGLNTDSWPALRPIADEQGHIFIVVDDDRLRVRMEEEERLRKSGS